MPFQKMKPSIYPPRLWELVGYPGSGKSTFATQMRSPILPIDADHRWSEVYPLNPDVLELSPNPLDHVDAYRIDRCLEEHMEGSGAVTIVVDSVTAIISPLVMRAILAKDAGDVKNLAAAMSKKAIAMRLLQDAVTRYGTAVLWVWHLQDARDENAKKVVRATLSPTEIARLHRSVNAQLHLVEDGSKHGIKVIWCRRGRSGLTLWDESGSWQGMPEKLEAAMYDELSEEEQRQIEQATPRAFQSPELAIAWGFERGAFKAIEHARNAYNKLKREQQPKDAVEMAALWTADVMRRLQQPDLFNGEHGEEEN